MSLEIKGEIEKLSLGPDDVLVVTSPGPLSPAARENVAETLRDAFGERRKVVVMHGGLKLSVVAEPFASVVF